MPESVSDLSILIDFDKTYNDLMANLLYNIL